MSSGGKLRVYDDGRCTFCQWAAAWVLKRDTRKRLVFRDYNEPAVAAETPFPVEQLRRSMHVQTPDGQWHAGYFAWIAILAVLPGWRWLARVLRLPPLRWLGPSIYQFVANHRYGVPLFMLRWLGAPVPCPPGGCALPERKRTGS